MFLINKPTSHLIKEFVASQSSLEFRYPMVALTRDEESPAGFTVDHHQVCLGAGRETFFSAKEALKDWKHYRFDWIELHRPNGPPVAAQTVGVLIRTLGLWMLVANRVVYVFEEETPVRRFGFAYGTLPEHPELGEERFQVEWREDDSVWYDIYAFSKPNQLLSRLGYLYVRQKQKQFFRESLLAMKLAVKG